MSQRLLSLFQTDNGESALVMEDGVSFRSFVRTLDFFGARTPAAVKMDALFKLYDCDGDGRVSERDLRSIMRMYMGSSVSEAALRVMSRNTMTHALASCTSAAATATEQPLVAPKPTRLSGSRSASQLLGKEQDAAASDALIDGAESEGRSLTFEQFSQAIGTNALEGMNVAVPIRE